MKSTASSMEQQDDETQVSVTSKGVLFKRKDFLGVDKGANSHPNRTYYYKKDHDLDDILVTCTKKLQVDPSDGRALFLRGSAYFKRRKYGLAIADLSGLLKHQPDHTEGLYKRGLAFSKVGDPESAIADFTTLLDLNPEMVNAAFARAACYNTLGMFNKAIEDYNFALLIDPSNGGGISGLAGGSAGDYTSSAASVMSDITSPQQQQTSPSQQYQQQLQHQHNSSDLMDGTIVRNDDSVNDLSGIDMANNTLEESRYNPDMDTGFNAKTPLRGSREKSSLADSFSALDDSLSEAATYYGRGFNRNAQASGAGRKESRGGEGHTGAGAGGGTVRHGADQPISLKAFLTGGSGAGAGGAGAAGGGSSQPSQQQQVVKQQQMQMQMHPLALVQQGAGTFAMDPPSPATTGRFQQVQQLRSGFPNNSSSGPFGPGDASGLAWGQSPTLSRASTPSSPSGSLAPISTLTPQSQQADEFHSRGIQFRRQGDFAKAIAEYSKAIELDPTHFKAFFNRGFAYDKLNRFDQAVADYTKSIQLEPRNPFCYYNRGISYDRMGALDKAFADFSQAISLQSDNVDFYYNRGFCLRKMGNMNEAVRDYSTSLELVPNNFKALYNRAYCLERLGRLEAALADQTAALAVQADHPGCLVNRAQLFEQLGRLPDAVRDLAQALKAGANPITTLSARSKLLAKLGKFKEAIQDLTIALDLRARSDMDSPPSGDGKSSSRGPEERKGCSPDEDELNLLFSRAMCLKSVDRFTDAVQDFSRIIKQDSSNAAVFSHRGYCYRKLEQYENALADYSAAILRSEGEERSVRIRAYNNRAFVLAKLDKYEEAIADYSKVIQIDPNNSHAFHNRGISYDKIGMIDQAIADFTKVLELDPQSAGVVPNIEALNQLSRMNAEAAASASTSASSDNTPSPSNAGAGAAGSGASTTTTNPSAATPGFQPQPGSFHVSRSAANKPAEQAGIPRHVERQIAQQTSRANAASAAAIAEAQAQGRGGINSIPTGSGWNPREKGAAESEPQNGSFGGGDARNPSVSRSRSPAITVRKVSAASQLPSAAERTSGPISNPAISDNSSNESNSNESNSSDSGGYDSSRFCSKIRPISTPTVGINSSEQLRGTGTVLRSPSLLSAPAAHTSSVAPAAGAAGATGATGATGAASPTNPTSSSDPSSRPLGPAGLVSVGAVGHPMPIVLPPSKPLPQLPGSPPAAGSPQTKDCVGAIKIPSIGARRNRASSNESVDSGNESSVAATAATASVDGQSTHVVGDHSSSKPSDIKQRLSHVDEMLKRFARPSSSVGARTSGNAGNAGNIDTVQLRGADTNTDAVLRGLRPERRVRTPPTPANVPPPPAEDGSVSASTRIPVPVPVPVSVPPPPPPAAAPSSPAPNMQFVKLPRGTSRGKKTSSLPRDPVLSSSLEAGGTSSDAEGSGAGGGGKGSLNSSGSKGGGSGLRVTFADDVIGSSYDDDNGDDGTNYEGGWSRGGGGGGRKISIGSKAGGGRSRNSSHETSSSDKGNSAITASTFLSSLCGTEDTASPSVGASRGAINGSPAVDQAINGRHRQGQGQGQQQDGPTTVTAVVPSAPPRHQQILQRNPPGRFSTPQPYSL